MAGAGASWRALALLLGAALAVLGGAPPAGADPSEEAPGAAAGDPDYAAGRRAILREDWPEAVRLLDAAARRDDRNADIHNHLGFAYRHLGDFASAFAHYEKALSLNPRHRGAHEYVGEAYLLVNEPGKAEAHLAALERICLLPCEELDDLRAAIAAYRAKPAAAPTAPR